MFKPVLWSVLIVLLLTHYLTEHVNADWRTASRESVGLAPDPTQTPEALIQVYSARAYGWRGYFGVHTWIAVKPSNANAYTVYEVIGWYLRRGGSVVAIHEQIPDRHWFGNVPQLLIEKRGEEVDVLIERIDRAAHQYPYHHEYWIWPGPNSNTFTAWISRAVPELDLDLPPTAIGKDFLGKKWIATAPSGHGWQWSMFGLLGVTVSQVEGFELNILGLTFGIDPNPFAIKLPLIGRVDIPILDLLSTSPSIQEK